MLDTSAVSPAEMVVLDEPESCPYLQGQIARLPLRLPARSLSPREADERWSQGDRRHGVLLYRPACPECRACEPIRVPVADFRPSAGQRRVLRRGDRELALAIERPRFSRTRLALFEKHKTERGLRLPVESRMGESGYRAFFMQACVDVLEMTYFHHGRLVGVAIVDRALRSLSAVYTFYDPELARLSLGTYSILKQIELCARWGLGHLYLGYYIADNPHMRYKARFRPHERLIEGTWQRFE